VVEHRQQRAPLRAVVNVLHQLEIPLARAVQDHVGLHKEGPHAPDVRERRLLRLLDVPERRARRGNADGHVPAPEPLKRRGLEMIEQGPLRRSRGQRSSPRRD